jgi:hypothetical protein
MPGLRIFSPLPAAILLRLALMLAYSPGLLICSSTFLMRLLHVRLGLWPSPPHLSCEHKTMLCAPHQLSSWGWCWSLQFRPRFPIVFRAALGRQTSALAYRELFAPTY